LRGKLTVAHATGGKFKASNRPKAYFDATFCSVSTAASVSA